MTEDKIEQLMNIADRIVARAKIADPVLRQDPDLFTRGMYWLIVAGKLGRRDSEFVSWMPVSEVVCQDEKMRSFLLSHARDMWQGLAKSHLIPFSVLTQPKGKLPA